MTEQLLKTKNLQKLEMLKALGHCNEVVGRMLYNAEQYFNIVQKVESSQKYKRLFRHCCKVLYQQDAH